LQSVNIVKFQSHCDIRTARETHAALLASFRSAEAVEIDAGDVAEADITLVQLIASATRTAEASGKPMRLIAVSEPLRAAFARAGVSASDGQITWS
jgi:anti-anti-sigma regulatory factor